MSSVMMEEAPVALPTQSKPYLTSHDSGEECSLEHLLQLRQTVECEFVEDFRSAES
jgi:hypothetical protein